MGGWGTQCLEDVARHRGDGDDALATQLTNLLVLRLRTGRTPNLLQVRRSANQKSFAQVLVYT